MNYIKNLYQKWMRNRAFNALFTFCVVQENLTNEDHTQCVLVLDILRKYMK